MNLESSSREEPRLPGDGCLLAASLLLALSVILLLGHAFLHLPWHAAEFGWDDPAAERRYHIQSLQRSVAIAASGLLGLALATVSLLRRRGEGGCAHAAVLFFHGLTVLFCILSGLSSFRAR